MSASPNSSPETRLPETLVREAARLQHVSRPEASHLSAASYPAKMAEVLTVADQEQAFASISRWPNYRPTRLVELSGLARELGLGRIFYKDESERFGLDSFKALGGAYAVHQLIEAHCAAPNSTLKPADITVAAATDGNHGRSVAWGAREGGCRCVIYIAAAVSKSREQSLASFGAEVVRLDGDYDATVRQVAIDAAANGWHLVPDTAPDPTFLATRHVMAGYTVLAREALQQVSGATGGQQPTHVLVQAGVGGVAAAVCAHLWSAQTEHNGPRPRMIVVEPESAACLLECAREGRYATVPIEYETMMAGLSCGEPSPIAWQVLETGADDYIAVADDLVPAAMRLLARSPYGDCAIVAGESAVPGLIALIAAGVHAPIADQLGLQNADNRILVIGTEGATDGQIYKRIVGKTAAEVLTA